MAYISGSVGASGQNRRTDVMIVQRLLAGHGANPGPLDGLCGPKTVGAILKFQSGFLPHPDGRVDPNGVTLRHLSQPVGTQARTGQSQPVYSAPPPVLVKPPPPAPGAAAGLTSLVPRPAANTINLKLEAVTSHFMIQSLGNPRENYSSDCQPMTNVALRRHVVTDSVGSFRVTGLKPAVESLRAALDQVKKEQPAVHHALGTAGMLCCRLIRGSKSAVSNHSWGTAIDFTLNNKLDRRGDGKVQLGLTLIASIMNNHGWYWGAAFRTEDAMHFEASKALISSWVPLLR